MSLKDDINDMESRGRLKGIGDKFLSPEDVMGLRSDLLQLSPALEHWPALRQLCNEILFMYPLQSCLQLIICLGMAYQRRYGLDAESE